MKTIEYKLFAQTAQKLTDYCLDANLEFQLDCGRYPIALTLRPGRYCRQMSLLSDEPGANPDAHITLTLEDGEIRVTAIGGFSVSADALNKVKTMFQKLSSYWTQYVFLTFATAQSGGLSNVTAEGVSALWRRAGADIGA